MPDFHGCSSAADDLQNLPRRVKEAEQIQPAPHAASSELHADAQPWASAMML
jgi:hypothetical protein